MRMNYNISVYLPGGKLIQEFHSRRDLERWLKKETFGSMRLSTVRKYEDMDTATLSVKSIKPLTGDQADVVSNMLLAFLNCFWPEGRKGCQEFYREVKKCCDGETDTFYGLKWQYNKVKGTNK